jgi:hypothetical protein
MKRTLCNRILEDLKVQLPDLKDWAVKKIELLHEADRHRNAKALEAEFDEWIHIPDGVEEIELFYIDRSALS